MSTQVILLERVEKLGNMGDVVQVKPGYARNFLLPQNKALRASKDNLAYFEAQKKTLEANNAQQRKEAEKLSSKLEGMTISLIRQASESGQLYGSVASRDIAEAATEASGITVSRNMVIVDRNFKELGLYDVNVSLHAEVTVQITINIARSAEEADMQEKTGKALVASAQDEAVAQPTGDDANLEAALEEGALEAEKERAAEKAISDAEAAEKAEAKAAVKAEKAEAKAQAEAEEAALAEEAGTDGEAKAEDTAEDAKSDTE